MFDPIRQFTERHTPLSVQGKVGQLETVVDAPEKALAQKSVAIICHPDPQQAGTMNNKVVTTVSRAFQEIGTFGVRFNYRGVGGSEGQYGNVIGEIEDALSVLEWVQEQFPDYPISLAGFSFGSYIAASLANQCEDIMQLITLAPSVVQMDFTHFNNVECPWLLVQGGADEVVSSESVLNWRMNMQKPIDLITMPTASHFFHGELIALRDKLVLYLKTGLTQA